MSELKEVARKTVAVFDKWIWSGIGDEELVKAMEELREAVSQQDEWEKEP
jgi:hypothetical protein